MINADACVLAVDAGGTFLKAVLMRKNCTAVEGSFIRTAVDSQGSADTIRTAYTQLAALGCQKAKALGLTLSAIGICIPGPFNYKGGYSLMTHKYAAIKEMPMRPWLKDGAGELPVIFLHDANAFLLGASRGVESRRIAGVTIGTGLGFAVMINGDLLKDERGGPGISIFSRPFKESTSEGYVSRKALLARYRELCGYSTDGLDLYDIGLLAEKGEKNAVLLHREMGQNLAAILHDILLENEIECLLLGGAVSKSAPLFLPQLRDGLSDLPLLETVRPAKDIDIAPLMGAAQAAFDELKL